MAEIQRILLAEDDENDVEMTMTALDQHNLANRVDVARDGEEALDYLYRRGKFADRAKGNPVVILLDLKMPKVDGLEVLKQIKSDHQLKMIPVVVLTTSKSHQDKVESFGLSVAGYMVKPVEYKNFVDTIKTIDDYWSWSEFPNVQ